MTWFQNLIRTQDFGWEYRVAEAEHLGILVTSAAVEGCERLVSLDPEAGAGDIGQRGSLIVVKDILHLLIARRQGSVVREGGWALRVLQAMGKQRLFFF